MRNHVPIGNLASMIGHGISVNILQFVQFHTNPFIYKPFQVVSDHIIYNLESVISTFF